MARRKSWKCLFTHTGKQAVPMGSSGMASGGMCSSGGASSLRWLDSPDRSYLLNPLSGLCPLF